MAVRVHPTLFHSFYKFTIRHSLRMPSESSNCSTSTHFHLHFVFFKRTSAYTLIICVKFSRKSQSHFSNARAKNTPFTKISRFSRGIFSSHKNDPVSQTLTSDTPTLHSHTININDTRYHHQPEKNQHQKTRRRTIRQLSIIYRCDKQW